jgi:hypothetical protein
LAFRSTTPLEGWEQALVLDLPEGEGAPGFALIEPEVTQYRSSPSFGPCTATNHYTMLFPVV